jgi:predicted amidohydrolase
MARKLRCYLVAGLVEVVGNSWFNTATLFDRQGRIAGRQRKVNLGSMERRHFGFTAGEGTFRVFATDFARVGIPVCIDFWGQPEAARSLTDQGAELIINPGIFPILREHWKYGALVRAFDNFIPVIGANAAPFNTRIGGRVHHIHGGHSMVIQPPRLVSEDDFRLWFRSLDTLAGWITVELDDREQVHIGEVDLATSRRFRSKFWNRLGISRSRLE